MVDVLEEVVTQVRTVIQRVRDLGISTEHCSMTIIVLQPRIDSHHLNLYHPHEHL
jgi:hypothetical protein